MNRLAGIGELFRTAFRIVTRSMMELGMTLMQRGSTVLPIKKMKHDFV